MLEHPLDLRVAAAVFCFALGALVTFANWRCFWLDHIKRMRSPSWTPLLGGPLLAVGLILTPVSQGSSLGLGSACV